MTQFFYQVSVGEDVIASDMTLEIAVILVKALFQEYHQETDLKITIKVQ